MFKLRPVIVLLALAVILTTTACNAILIGSGNVITETRQVSDFDNIVLEGSGEVIVTQDGSETLTIEAGENVMEHVMAEVEGRTLKLGLKEGTSFLFSMRLTFHVGVDDLSSLDVAGSGKIEADLLESDHLDAAVSGSGNIRIADLAASEVKAQISGSGEIELGGDAAVQDITVSGSGSYQGGDMCSESVKVNISGSGKATVCATQTLDAGISGSGSVNYYGQPAVNISGSGSGNVKNLGEK